MASSVKTLETRSGSCASMPAFHRSRASRRASASGTLTTVHMQDLAGDERRFLQIHYGLDDIVDVADVPERSRPVQLFVARWVVHGGTNVAESDGVATDAVLRVLDGQFLGDCVQSSFGQRRQRGWHRRVCVVDQAGGDVDQVAAFA